MFYPPLRQSGMALTAAMFPSEYCCSPNVEKKLIHKEKSKIGKKHQERFIKEALNCATPQSLGAVARALGVDVKSLRNNFPEYCSEIVRASRAYRSSQVKKRHNQVEMKIRRVVERLEEKSIPVTHRNVQQAYGKPIMPKSYSHTVLSLILNS